MSIVLSCNSITELPNIAQKIIELGSGYDIWFFEGEMAAGKTTLIKEICKQLGVASAVQSPTYSLVNEYVATYNQIIYHFDFYRLKTEDEALDYGVEEYFDSGNLCIGEWPSIIPSLWPQKYMLVAISVIENGGRTIEMNFVN